MRINAYQSMSKKELRKVALDIGQLLLVEEIAIWIDSGKKFSFFYRPLLVNVTLQLPRLWHAESEIDISQEVDGSLTIEVGCSMAMYGAREFLHATQLLASAFNATDRYRDWVVLAQICYGDIPKYLLNDDSTCAAETDMASVIESTSQDVHPRSGADYVDVRNHFAWKYLGLARRNVYQLER